MHATSDNLLSTAETAELLRVSVPTVLRMAKDGRLPAHHKFVGRTTPYIFHRDVVARVAAERNLS